MVNPELDSATVKYIFYFGLSQYEEIRKQAAGGNQPNLNAGKIKSWIVNFPPLEEQKEIVSRIEAFFERADLIEQQYELLKEKIEHLPQAILAKAFRGELVPQDPTDEPVEELLQNIQRSEIKRFYQARTRSQCVSSQEWSDECSEQGDG